LAVQAVEVATVALATGLPDYGEHRQLLAGALVIDVLLAYGLYKGSRLAWGLSVLMAVFGLFLYSVGMRFSDEVGLKYPAVALLPHRALRPPARVAPLGLR